MNTLHRTGHRWCELVHLFCANMEARDLPCTTNNNEAHPHHHQYHYHTLPVSVSMDTLDQLVHSMDALVADADASATIWFRGLLLPARGTVYTYNVPFSDQLNLIFCIVLQFRMQNK